MVLLRQPWLGACFPAQVSVVGEEKHTDWASGAESWLVLRAGSKGESLVIGRRHNQTSQPSWKLSRVKHPPNTDWAVSTCQALRLAVHIRFLMEWPWQHDQGSNTFIWQMRSLSDQWKSSRTKKKIRMTLPQEKQARKFESSALDNPEQKWVLIRIKLKIWLWKWVEIN